MKYIDIHCHLNFPDYGSELPDIIKRAQEAEVGVINVGVDVKSSEEVVQLAHTHKNMWAVVGVHPTDNKEEIDYPKLKELAQDPKVVAIGECGLDFHHAGPEDIDRQKEIFIQHIELANEIKKPLMLHVRNGKTDLTAYVQALEILKKHAKVPFNFHFFAGSLDDLKLILEAGGTVSFTGVVTFVKEFEEIVKYVPADRFMTETDAPFASPEPYRGKRNEPAHVREVVKAVARIRGEDPEKVARQCVDNARKLFGI